MVGFIVSANSPKSRAGYTATLLSNGVILYIGGYQEGSLSTFMNTDLSKIFIYDTKTSTWSNKVASLKGSIQNRDSTALTAVLGKLF